MQLAQRVSQLEVPSQTIQAPQVRRFLNITDDELRAALTDLPPAYLNQLTKQTVDSINTRTLKPEARIDDDRAVVKLSRARNSLMVSLTRTSRSKETFNS